MQGHTPIMTNSINHQGISIAGGGSTQEIPQTFRDSTERSENFVQNNRRLNITANHPLMVQTNLNQNTNGNMGG